MSSTLCCAASFVGTPLAARRRLSSSRRVRPCGTRCAAGDGGGDNLSWDAGRFVQTVLFFNPPPSPQEVVENLISSFTGSQKTAPSISLADGANPTPVFAVDEQGRASGMEFGALDDVVMGGVSDSGFMVEAGMGENGAPAGVFRGTVRTENNGGFVSVRTRNYDPPYDMRGANGLAMRVKGDGMRYKAILRTDPGWDSLSYCLSFDTVDGEWQTVNLAFADFRAIFRAKSVPGAAPLDPSTVYSLQLMLSKFEYDGELNPNFKAGDFALPVASILPY